ncbi:MAG: enoyl-CoA hydratase/isomerase family protein [Pirellulales bacterium]|nr:enoyl-CoA hydratase/isomerase family protein [Pirellulales bacterium]
MFLPTAPVQVKVHDQSGTIILNRPDRRNATTRAMLIEIQQALDDLYYEKRVRAIVLTGAGSAFCAGMDLAEMQATAELPNPEAEWGADAEAYRSLIEKMLETTKPIIAAVNGPAVAGGAGLVLASDIVVASYEAQFGFPEPRRGVVSGIVAPLLAFRLGTGPASRLLLTSMLIDATEAHRIGIYHELTDNDHVWARANDLAGECAAGAPEALQLTKRLITETLGEHLATHLAVGAITSATARTTEAAAEGVTAFLEKRKPKWK